MIAGVLSTYEHGGCVTERDERTDSVEVAAAREVPALHEQTTPVPAMSDETMADETTTDHQSDQDTGSPGWAGAMAQIDAEIDELRALLARRRAEDAAALDAAAREQDGPGSAA